MRPVVGYDKKGGALEIGQAPVAMFKCCHKVPRLALGCAPIRCGWRRLATPDEDLVQGG